MKKKTQKTTFLRISIRKFRPKNDSIKSSINKHFSVDVCAVFLNYPRYFILSVDFNFIIGLEKILRNPKQKKIMIEEEIKKGFRCSKF